MKRNKPIVLGFLLGSLAVLVAMSAGSAFAAKEPHDFNGDGRADLVWRNTQTGAVAVWLMNGTTRISTGVPGAASLDWAIAGVGDVDGDGRADLVWRNTSTGQTAIWLMNGTTRASVDFPPGVPLAWQIAGIGDVTGDGQADVIWRNTTNGQVAVWVMNGTIPTSTGFPGGASLDWAIAGVGDMDGDGRADLVWRNTSTGQTAIWLMEGTVRKSSGFPGGVPLAWQIAGIGDVTGDGQADVIWRNTTNGQVAVWVMNGTIPTSTGFPGGASLDWAIAGVGDVDGDGRADLVWWNTSTGQTAIWLMEGTVRKSSGFPGGAPLVWQLPQRPAQSGIPNLTLSGTITPTEGARVDGDVNDPNAPFASNDSFATAQLISNPVTLGGYVNEPGKGQPGRSQTAGDVSDFFEVSLGEKQTIQLFIADDPAINDLDLVLYDANGDLVDFSIGTGLIESVTNSTAGTFFVQVMAFEGASNYSLTVGQDIPTPSFGSLTLSSDFVPGEVVVRFSPPSLSANGQNALASDSQSLAQRGQSIGMLGKSGGPGREMLMEMPGEDQQDQMFHALEAYPAYQRSKAIFQGLSPMMRKKLDTLMAIKALRRRTDVKAADPNYLRYPLLIPDDAFFPIQWHYPMINLPQAWDITTGSSDVVVAVVDTGVLLNHPDLQGQLLPGYDFISDPLRARDGDGIDPNPDDSGDVANRDGTASFHGTHVAGTVAARSNNRIGVAGVSWASRIMPIRVLGVEGGEFYDILQGVRFAAGLPNDSGTLPARRADIINLSLGGRGFSQAAQDLYTEVRNAGVIVIAAAGNGNIPNGCATCLNYPASYDGVMSVSAVDIGKNLAWYSSYGTKVDVAAPGGDIRKDLNGDGSNDGVQSTCGVGVGSNDAERTYCLSQGTSMASPHMAGVAALMKAVNPSLTPQDLDNLLSSGAITEDLGFPGRDDQFGYGLIDARKAVQAAQNLTGPPPQVNPRLAVNPTALNFGLSQTSILASLTNAGDGTLTVSNVSQNSSGWLSASPASVDANGLGTYVILVNRSGLSPGTFTAEMTFSSSANAVTVPVIMQVGIGSIQDNAGYHYVLLIDPTSGQTVAQTDVGVTNGVYHYQFTGIAPGSYQIVAGTDSDNDDFICDAGEACGRFGGFDLPSDLIVSGSLRNLDFTTGFNPIFRSQAASGARELKMAFPRLQRKGLKEVP